MRNVLKLALGSVALLLSILACGGETEVTEPPPPANGDSFTRYVDEGSFLAASGAAATVTYPTERDLITDPYVENGVSLVQADGRNNAVGDFTAVLPDNEFVVSGVENVDIEFGTSVHSFGIWMHDGPDFDSSFEFRFISNGETVATLTEDPAVDVAFFLGAISSQAIDRIEIREVGTDDENDHFGVIYTNSSPPSSGGD